jgi:ferritin-like protein
MEQQVTTAVGYKDIVSNHALHNFILNVYRYNENNRALRLSKFAELVTDHKLKILVAKHFADEAKHAFLFTKRLLDLGADIYPLPQEIDYLYKLESSGIGISLERMLELRELTDDEIVRFLVADEFLEERGVKTLSEHLAVTTDAKTHSLINAILRDEKSHVSYINETLAGINGLFVKERIAELYSEYRDMEEKVHEEQWDALQKEMMSFL